MPARLTKHIRRILLAWMGALVVVGAPPAVMIATTQPALATSSAPSCVSGGLLSARQVCNDNLAAAESKWPDAALALGGVTAGNGSWIIPNKDGAHFDLVTVQIGTGKLAVRSGNPVAQAHRLVEDVFAYNLAGSGSGSINTSGYHCGDYIGWSGYVSYTTYYNAHLEMDLTGSLNFCNSATTSTLTPIVYGAASWTNSNGIIGNGTTQTNPWINWYGSNVLGCCSDTVLERYYMDAWGNYSWDVYN